MGRGVQRSAGHIACTPFDGENKPAFWLAISGESVPDTYLVTVLLW